MSSLPWLLIVCLESFSVPCMSQGLKLAMGLHLCQLGGGGRGEGWVSSYIRHLIFPSCHVHSSLGEL